MRRLLHATFCKRPNRVSLRKTRVQIRLCVRTVSEKLMATVLFTALLTNLFHYSNQRCTSSRRFFSSSQFSPFRLRYATTTTATSPAASNGIGAPRGPPGWADTSWKAVTITASKTKADWAALASKYRALVASVLTTPLWESAAVSKNPLNKLYEMSKLLPSLSNFFSC